MAAAQLLQPCGNKSVVSSSAVKFHQWRTQRLTVERRITRCSKHGVVCASQSSNAVANAETSSESLRLIPLLAGAAGGSAVLINRIINGVAPVTDASSSQTRADVACLILSASLLLTGLSWLALKPKPQIPVSLDGLDCLRLAPSIRPSAADDLLWAWRALCRNTCCRAFLVVAGVAQGGEEGPGSPECVMLAGRVRRERVEGLQPAAEGEEPVSGESQGRNAQGVEFGRIATGREVGDLLAGNICSSALGTGKCNYLANLVLFPARVELLSFFPDNTQCAIVEPLTESRGVMILAGDTIRGFTPLQQAWISTIAQKLDATLSGDA